MGWRAFTNCGELKVGAFIEVTELAQSQGQKVAGVPGAGVDLPVGFPDGSIKPSKVIESDGLNLVFETEDGKKITAKSATKEQKADYCGTQASTVYNVWVVTEISNRDTTEKTG